MTTRSLTLDDLEQMPDDAMHRELIDGELIELPPPQINHVKIAKKVFLSLNQHCDQANFGEAYIEAGYKITADKRNWIQPDVSYVTEIRPDDTDRFFFGAPDLAVEVISPSERPKHILAKRLLLFREGCQEIWIIRPKTRKLEVWTATGLNRTLTENDTLSSPLFEGWSMRVSDIFA
jgi:Uma2 family endonuclease